MTNYTLDDNGLITSNEDSTELSTGLPFTIALTRFGHALVAQAGDVEGGFQFNTGALPSVDLDSKFSSQAEVVSDSVAN